MRRKFLTLAEFRSAYPKEDHPKGFVYRSKDRPIVRAVFKPEIKAGDGEDSRLLRFTISTESVDRMGDTIAVDGWDLTSFKKNPVVLWAHDSSDLPVAKASNVAPVDGALQADAEFAPPALYEFADQVFRFYKAGFLSAVSVGFVPHKWAWVDDNSRPFGIAFMEQELLEFSAVPVPANPEALIEEGVKPGSMPAKSETEPAPFAHRHANRRREIERLSLA